MDGLVEECIEEAYDDARLGRVGDLAGRNRVLAETLADLEIAGAAMRYVDAKGRTAWKATEWLRDHLENLRLDAELDFDHEDT
jgi:hypothetical protein